MSLLRQQNKNSAAHYATIDQENAAYAESSKFIQSSTNSGEKMSYAMRESLQELHNSLQCPLCTKVVVQPVTLPACGHTFCTTCIDKHSENSWSCPVQSCMIPITMKSTHKGKFRNINASTQTVVNSWNIICQTLMKADDKWWRKGEDDDDVDQDDDDDEDDCSSFATAADEF